jgi:hypothetical protein
MSVILKQSARARRFVLASFFSSLLTYSLTHLLTPDALAASKSDRYQLQVGETGQAGTGTSSSGSGRRMDVAVGGAVAGGRITSGRFIIRQGFFEAAFGSAVSVPPPDELDLSVLYAKTHPLGLEIPPRVWQTDADPLFIWEPPSAGLAVAGYSYAMEAEPDDQIETVLTSWNVAEDPLRRLADGVHVFRVKAIGLSGQAGAARAFELWVDTAPPTISGTAPGTGALINTRSPLINATLADAHSGVDDASVAVLVNGRAVNATVDEATGALTASGLGAVEEGVNRIELRVSDTAGNAQTPLVWTFTADATPPSGRVLINGGSSMTTSVYVTLTLTAGDETSGVTAMLLGNDPVLGYVEEPFATVRELWRLNAVRGLQRVYVKFKDAAGNISEAVLDAIELQLLAPETLILSGPAGLRQERDAAFTFGCPESDCVFSYAFDHDEWSDWSAETAASADGLVFGNHYFKVKASKEANGIPGIQPDEEDPTPAERTWIIGVEGLSVPLPRGSPIKLWRFE